MFGLFVILTQLVIFLVIGLLNPTEISPLHHCTICIVGQGLWTIAWRVFFFWGVILLLVSHTLFTIHFALYIFSLILFSFLCSIGFALMVSNFPLQFWALICSIVVVFNCVSRKFYFDPILEIIWGFFTLIFVLDCSTASWDSL